MRDQSRGNELLLALERHLRVGKVGGPLRHGGARRGDLLDAEAAAQLLELRPRPHAHRRSAAAPGPRPRALLRPAPPRPPPSPRSSCRMREPLVGSLGYRPEVRFPSRRPAKKWVNTLPEHACRPRTGDEFPP